MKIISLFLLLQYASSALTCRRSTLDIEWWQTYFEEAQYAFRWSDARITEWSNGFVDPPTTVNGDHCEDTGLQMDILRTSGFNGNTITHEANLEAPIKIHIKLRVPCSEYWEWSEDAHAFHYDVQVFDIYGIRLGALYDDNSNFQAKPIQVKTYGRAGFHPNENGVIMNGTVFADQYGEDNFHELIFDIQLAKVQIFYNGMLLETSQTPAILGSGAIILYGGILDQMVMQHYIEVNYNLVIEDNSCISTCDAKYDCNDRGVPQKATNSQGHCGCQCYADERGKWDSFDCLNIVYKKIGTFRDCTNEANGEFDFDFVECANRCENDSKCSLFASDSISGKCKIWQTCIATTDGWFNLYQMERVCHVSLEKFRNQNHLEDSTFANDDIWMFIEIPTENFELTNIEFHQSVGACASFDIPGHASCQKYYWTYADVGCLRMYTGRFPLQDVWDGRYVNYLGFEEIGNRLISTISITVDRHEFAAGTIIRGQEVVSFPWKLVLNTITTLDLALEPADKCSLQYVRCLPCEICSDGACAPDPGKNGFTCDDGNDLTSDDMCFDGNCEGTPICDCPTCQTCLLEERLNAQEVRCVADFSKEGQPCNDGVSFTSDDICTQGQCRGVIQSPCQCGSRSCDGQFCCRNSGCDQSDLILPQCAQGGCDQTDALEPTCDGGNCNQDSAIRPTCKGGNCSQVGAISPACDGGECDQLDASNPDCAGGQCPGNCEFTALVQCGCKTCSRGRCLNDPPYLPRDTPCAFGDGVCSLVGVCNIFPTTNPTTSEPTREPSPTPTDEMEFEITHNCQYIGTNNEQYVSRNIMPLYHHLFVGRISFFTKCDYENERVTLDVYDGITYSDETYFATYHFENGVCQEVEFPDGPDSKMFRWDDHVCNPEMADISKSPTASVPTKAPSELVVSSATHTACELHPCPGEPGSNVCRRKYGEMVVLDVMMNSTDVILGGLMDTSVDLSENGRECVCLSGYDKWYDVCTKNFCFGVTCPPCQTCIDGECFPKTSWNGKQQRCSQCEVCEEGTCIPNSEMACDIACNPCGCEGEPGFVGCGECQTCKNGACIANSSKEGHVCDDGLGSDDATCANGICGGSGGEYNILKEILLLESSSQSTDMRSTESYVNVRAQTTLEHPWKMVKPHGNFSISAPVNIIHAEFHIARDCEVAWGSNCEQEFLLFFIVHGACTQARYDIFLTFYDTNAHQDAYKNLKYFLNLTPSGGCGAILQEEKLTLQATVTECDEDGCEEERDVYIIGERLEFDISIQRPCDANPNANCPPIESVEMTALVMQPEEKPSIVLLGLDAVEWAEDLDLQYELDGTEITWSILLDENRFAFSKETEITFINTIVINYGSGRRRRLAVATPIGYDHAQKIKVEPYTCDHNEFGGNTNKSQTYVREGEEITVICPNNNDKTYGVLCTANGWASDPRILKGCQEEQTDPYEEYDDWLIWEQDWFPIACAIIIIICVGSCLGRCFCTRTKVTKIEREGGYTGGRRGSKRRSSRRESSRGSMRGSMRQSKRQSMNRGSIHRGSMRASIRRNSRRGSHYHDVYE